MSVGSSLLLILKNSIKKLMIFSKIVSLAVSKSQLSLAKLLQENATQSRQFSLCDCRVLVHSSFECPRMSSLAFSSSSLKWTSRSKFSPYISIFLIGNELTKCESIFCESRSISSFHFWAFVSSFFHWVLWSITSLCALTSFSQNAFFTKVVTFCMCSCDISTQLALMDIVAAIMITHASDSLRKLNKN